MITKQKILIVDVGGGTTDIAILSLGGIVTSSSIKIAGNVFDADIVKYIKEKPKKTNYDYFLEK